MPPTVQTNDPERDKRPQRAGERRSELVTRVKYCNTLPDIPFDLKFITYPFPSTRFIQYNPTSLEKNYRYEVLTEHDLGVHIDLINRDIYQGDGNAVLDPADEKLLEDDILTPQDSKRSRHHAKNVSWLRRSEYISTEQTRFQPQSMEKVEAKVGYNVKKIFSEETLYMDRESQIKAIEKTFEDNKKPIEKHYSKPGVTPVEIMEVFPDFDMWKYPCAQVIFDSDPAPADKNIAGQIEAMSQAMIRGVMDESGEQFVAYCLPTEETIQKRRRDIAENMLYMDGDTYEYKMAREYNWNVKSKASKVPCLALKTLETWGSDKSIFGYLSPHIHIVLMIKNTSHHNCNFKVIRNHCVYYNELETRVRLSKRRARAGVAAQALTRLVVTHRPLSAAEHRMLRLREKQLEPPQEEDEEEEEDDDDDDEDKQEQNGEKESRLKDQIGRKLQNQDQGLEHGIVPARDPNPNRNPEVGLVLDLVPGNPDRVLGLHVPVLRDLVQFNLVLVPALDLVQSLDPAHHREHLPAQALKVERDLVPVLQVEGVPGPVLKPVAMVQEQVLGQVHVPHLGQASDPREHPREDPVPHPSQKLQAPRHLLVQVLEGTPDLEARLTGQEVDLEADLEG
ncbi:hypothetical protein HF086_002273 [Spodoptera exigua]|uniref:RNA polymerase II-associated factor 1 homolog n=1 Tax=Spodoptera exigua TaxID=7107 RepID=A0A922SN31_SPOEX|nr:hypothetical protein HF086_002273 [Spodoptera exigua]